MDMTQSDYDERLTRVAEGTADDEDRRLVKHYEREGFEPSGDAPADGSWLLDGDSSDEEPGDGATGYAAMNKRELKAELDKRTDLNGAAVQYPGNANNKTLIELLEQNDREHGTAGD